MDFAFPEPDQAAVTTIAWPAGPRRRRRARDAQRRPFGRPATDYQAFEYAGSADQALAQLDEEYARWTEGPGSRPDGLREAVRTRRGAVGGGADGGARLHINRELIHHGAEVALLRDLYAHRAG